jgi:hypothetical protein
LGHDGVFLISSSVLPPNSYPTRYYSCLYKFDREDAPTSVTPLESAKFSAEDEAQPTSGEGLAGLARAVKQKEMMDRDGASRAAKESGPAWLSRHLVAR